ncbi:MAG TPA: metallophosphoesterase, partial [Aggregatilineales bacterium]|nr:metallophosphoesterase [Aggregatilineales bacterium]
MGDLIHGYVDPVDDHSLRMALRVMELQKSLGEDYVIMLLGNHEMPHIYGVSLAKGELEFTPRFERTMGKYREILIEFFKGLPLAVRTSAGVLVTHAGPDENSINRGERLRRFNHDDLLQDADQTLAQQADLEKVYETYAQLSGQSY